MLANRRLAVSFHVAGDSGPMTWHAKALTTSYLSGPRTGAHGAEEAESAFPFSTTSWYFLDEVEMDVPGAKTVVAFGDSITDGTASTPERRRSLAGRFVSPRAWRAWQPLRRGQ